MESLKLPSKLYTSTLSSFLDLVQSLHKSIDSKDYSQVVAYSSIAISQLSPSKLLQAFLDVRAHAYFALGNTQAALTDAQRMVDCDPRSAVGYLRKGYYLSSAGEHRRAAEVYKNGFKKAQADREEMDLLSKGKTRETLLSTRKVDFIARLPTEVTSQIISRLPQETVTTCLIVSTIWRQRTFHCESIWTSLSITENRMCAPFINVTRHMGCHVKYLTIDVNSNVANARCMKRLKEGHFTNLVSLKMTGNSWTSRGAIQVAEQVAYLAISTRKLQLYFDALSHAFWEARATLTTLDLDLGDNRRGITLTEVLLSCSYVTSLTYSTKVSLSRMGDNFSLLDHDRPLENLELTARSITGANIDIMIQCCQRLRRLVMDGCDISVFQPITEHTPRNLEVLAYNPDIKVAPLSKKHNAQPGLRKLYSNSSGAKVDALSILPLMYKGRKTLETLYVNITSLNDTELQQVYTRFPDFKFPKLQDLTFWFYRGVQPLILHTICNTDTLTHLYAIKIHDINVLIKVLMKMPPVKVLELADVDTISNQSSLITLLERYARLSTYQPRLLERIILRSCNEVTDSVLDVLADITTIKQVSFRKLRNVTTEGITRFIKKRKAGLSYVKLSGMNAVTDSVLTTLGDLKKLTAINLSDLQNVTDHGVRGMIDGYRCKMSRLTISDCPAITENCIEYAKERIKAVVSD